MTSLLASLALALATAQHAAAPAPASEHAAAATQEGSQHAAAAGAHGGESDIEEFEEEAEKREEGLSQVMIGHVADGYVLEYPGYCHGGFSWECETNLRKVFGKSLVFHVGGTTLDMTPTRHLVMMWIASIILLVVVLAAVARKSVVPSGLYNFVEMLVKFVRDEMAKKNIGEHDGDRFVPYLVSVFFFILFVNLFGLVPWTATATGNIAVTVALAGFTFLITQYAAIKAMGLGGWLHHLTGGVHPLLWPIMIPVEILGLFTKPFALTIRLFANMIAGHFVIMGLLGLIFALGTPFVAVGSIPVALGIFMLELFVAFVQAYIFTMLSSLFIGQGLASHGHGGDEEHAGAAEPGMGHAPDHASHASHVAGNAPGHG